MAAVATEMKGLGTGLLDREGKYLTFALAHEEYGLEILKVREIIGYMEITAVPQTPHLHQGRHQSPRPGHPRGGPAGQVRHGDRRGHRPDLHHRRRDRPVAAASSTPASSSTASRRSSTSPARTSRKPPQFGASVDTDFILGMGKVGESVKILLDIDKVLSGTGLGFCGNAADAGDPLDKANRSKDPHED